MTEDNTASLAAIHAQFHVVDASLQEVARLFDELHRSRLDGGIMTADTAAELVRAHAAQLAQLDQPDTTEADGITRRTAPTQALRVGELRSLDAVEEELTGANLSLWEEEQDNARLRLALASAKRRALRRLPHEREGLIFHLERENKQLHSFVRVANEAARVSHTGWERYSGEAARQREEAARLRARVTELEAAPATIYRAEHPDSGITLGHYGTEAAARAHCEAEERRSWGPQHTLVFDWIENDEDRVAELVVTAGQNEESATGYIVTSLELDSEYDAEAEG